jgi:mono/diheme cytochrome c family protein
MKLQHVLLALVLVVVGIVAIAGFRGDHFTRPPFEIFPDMNYQGKVKDQVTSSFFADGVASRPPVPGTIAAEMPILNDYWSTGKWDETHWGDGIPVHESQDGGRPLQIDAANMSRGRERYNINCAVCHGAAGDGQGITSKYGLNGAASYHNDRLRADADGDLFNTISNGHGQMLGYAYNISIDDRWRIIMYIRALQRSQNASLDDASPEEQKDLQAKAQKPAGSAMNQPSAKGTNTSYKIKYLDQHTMVGWMDSLDEFYNGPTRMDFHELGYRQSSDAPKLMINRHTLGDWTQTDISDASAHIISTKMKKASK